MRRRVTALAVRLGETLCYLGGFAFCGFFLVQLAQGEVRRQSGISEFELMAQATIPAHSANSASSDSASSEPVTPDFEGMVGVPDTSLWAPGRIDDYRASLNADLPPVLGVLEVPSVNLKVPVYQTASDLVMDRGAGIVNGMSYPHEPGNIGISGHRDGYFRALKDVKVGDSILLQTLEGPKRFRIDDTEVVEITDKRLLQDTYDQTVTLVTCYPFYFVGNAPQRFIVTASLDTTDVNQK